MPGLHLIRKHILSKHKTFQTGIMAEFTYEQKNLMLWQNWWTSLIDNTQITPVNLTSPKIN